MQKSATYWIDALQLEPHVEGGYYKECYRSPQQFLPGHLPWVLQGSRNFSTSIYFLLSQDEFSAFHRISSDEIWHFYAGDPLVIYELSEGGAILTHKLGNNPEKGEVFQIPIRAGHWFASRLDLGGSYCLVGCTVCPGFDFHDFELASREKLILEFPQHALLIRSLTR
jgi:uncharacterized protein